MAGSWIECRLCQRGRRVIDAFRDWKRDAEFDTGAGERFFGCRLQAEHRHGQQSRHRTIGAEPGFAGPLTRSVEDVVLVMAILSGPDCRDTSGMEWLLNLSSFWARTAIRYALACRAARWLIVRTSSTLCRRSRLLWQN